MSKHISETPATQWLKQNKVTYTEHPYDYVDHGGTAESSKQLGVPEHHVIKTLVMQDEQGKGLVVLMHGNCKTSTKNLRGFLVCIAPQVLVNQLGGKPVQCALPQ